MVRFLRVCSDFLAQTNLSRIGRRVGALLLLSTAGAVWSQTLPENQFDGRLEYVGHCDSESPPPFIGAIKAGRIVGRTGRGKAFDWPVAADGSFGGEMELRPHKLGMKIQRYSGRVADGFVTVEAYYGVPGHPPTECRAKARLPLH